MFTLQVTFSEQSLKTMLDAISKKHNIVPAITPQEFASNPDMQKHFASENAGLHRVIAADTKSVLRSDSSYCKKLATFRK